MKKADYGFDAPGIMQGLLAAGIGGIGIGLALRLFTHGIWPILGALVLVLALIPLALGCAMLAYGMIGKARIRDKIIAALNLQGHEQVLDIGTGRGLLLIAAAKRLTTGHATGIDIFRSEDLSNNTMAALQSNIAAEGVAARVTAQSADARAMPFADASFDVVLSLYCIHNIERQPEQDRALHDAFRVLKPGGRITLGEWLPTHRYAAVLTALGATEVSTHSDFATALAPMWLTTARKPA